MKRFRVRCSNPEHTARGPWYETKEQAERQVTQLHLKFPNQCTYIVEEDANEPAELRHSA